MKIKFSTILTLTIVAFCMCLVLSAHAQEEGSSLNEFQDLNQNSELNLEEDKTLLFEGESKPVFHEHEVFTPNNTETKTISSESTKASSKEEEDALSFNFLYYIIQKFKYSDLVDQ